MAFTRTIVGDLGDDGVRILELITKLFHVSIGYVVPPMFRTFTVYSVFGYCIRNNVVRLNFKNCVCELNNSYLDKLFVNEKNSQIRLNPNALKHSIN